MRSRGRRRHAGLRSRLLRSLLGAIGVAIVPDLRPTPTCSPATFPFFFLVWLPFPVCFSLSPSTRRWFHRGHGASKGMAEQYDISLKNTFLHFVSHEASAEGKSLFRSRSASCPCLYFKGVAAKSGHARLEQDVLSPHAGYVEKGTGKEQSQSKSHDSGSWRKINHELIEAARKGTYDKILSAAGACYVDDSVFVSRFAGAGQLR